MIKAVIAKIQEYIPKIEEEDAKIDTKYGIDKDMGISLFDENSIKHMYEKREALGELKKELHKQDYVDLLKIETLLYFGRDDEPKTFAGNYDYLVNMNESKEDIIRTILEKLPAFHDYISDAIKKLEKEGLELSNI